MEVDVNHDVLSSHMMCSNLQHVFLSVIWWLSHVCFFMWQGLSPAGTRAGIPLRAGGAWSQLALLPFPLGVATPRWETR